MARHERQAVSADGIDVNWAIEPRLPLVRMPRNEPFVLSPPDQCSPPLVLCRWRKGVPDASSRVVGCRRSTHAEEPGACWRLDASDRQFESQRGSKDRPSAIHFPLEVICHGQPLFG